MSLARILLLLAMTLPVLVTGSAGPAAAAEADDAAMIRRVIGETWDRPDGKVQTDPVVVAGDAAVASWTQGEHGGRALLRQRSGHWHVVLCSGDPLKSADTLRDAGVPPQQAASLAQSLAAAEAKLPGDRVAMFSRFQGLVPMDAPAQHHGEHRH